MDTSEYMPMFVAETREHLEQLNLAIVRLEEDPKDRGTVEEIFRIAHSLKGMSATMGFSRIAELTHAMEDVFELLRQRTTGLPVEAIDTVFACLDALSVSVESIETDGEEALDPVPLVTRLRSLVRPRTPEQEMARVGIADPLDHAAVIAAQEAGTRVLRVHATLDEEVLMPAVRAHMVLAALGDHGEILASAPPRDALEQFQGREIDAWIASDHEDEAIAANVRGVSEVFTVEVNELPKAAAPAVTEVEQPAAEPAVAATAPAATAEAKTEVTPEAKAEAKTSTQTRTVRVDAERLDALMHSMGELVIHRTAVEALTAKLEIEGLQQAVQELTRSSQALQAMVMQVRM
ncbi:MAG TPA: Hpt domain-containing protein, partial [Solirubrobacteraceae bacterium]